VPILIDGHNLIGRLPTLSLQDPDDEAKLVRMLVSYRAGTGRKITVVFDPGGGYALAETRRQGGIEVVFAPHGSNADTVIARRVRRSRDPRGLLVVTSDRGLAETVTRLGARVRPAQAFAAELEQSSAAAQDAEQDALPAEKDTPPTSEEVEAWLELFEDKD
jgi:predicted RNA-binding protein with PIN domain